MNPDELLLIGYIAGGFGVHGQLKMKAVTDQPDHLKQHIRTVYLGASTPPERASSTAPPRPYRLRQVDDYKPGMLLLTLDGVTTRETADSLRSTEVFIQARDALPLDEDEYYLHELYNLRVETTDGVEIGVVREVLETGAHEVLVVARPNHPDALIPMIRDIVHHLDPNNGRIVIRLIEGLL
jgi:16S rRNA processing protein RimM